MPKGWRLVQEKPDRDPEAELGKLKRRFERAATLRRLRGKAKSVGLAILLIAVGLAFRLR